MEIHLLEGAVVEGGRGFAWAGPLPAQPGADQTPPHRKMGLGDSQPQGPIVQLQEPDMPNI